MKRTSRLRDFICALLVALLALPAPPALADEVFTLTAIADATLQQALPTTNDGVSAILRALSQSGGNIRHLVQFDLTSLDSTAAAKTSRLKMLLNTAPSQSRNLSAHLVTAAGPWTEANVTWNDRDTGTPWSAAGGDFNASPADTQSSGTTSGTTLTWNIRTDGTVSNIPQGWLDSSLANLGLLIKDATENDAAHAVVNKVISGSGTMCNTGFPCTTTLTFPGGQSVDTTRSFLIFQTRSSTTVQNASHIRGQIASPTTVRFVRTGDSTTVNVQYYVIEFSSGVFVERGTIAQSATAFSQTLSPPPGVTSTSQMFVLHSKTPSTTADNAFDTNNPVVAEISSTTQLDFRVGSASTGHTIDWEVVYFTNPADILVQRGAFPGGLSGSNTFNTATLGTAVDPTRSFVLISYQSASASFGGTDIGGRLMRASLTNCSPNCSTVRVDRQITGSPDDIDEVHYQVVQLNTGATVQTGSQTFASGVPSPATPAQSVANVTLPTLVDTTRSFAFAPVQYGGGQNLGSTTWQGNHMTGMSSFTFALGSAQPQLTIQRNYTGVNNFTGAITQWYVAEMNNASPALVQLASREDSTPANRPQLDVSLLRNVSLGSVTPGISEVTLNWTFPSGSTSSNYDGVLIARRQGLSAPTFAPADGTTYTVGQQPVAGEFIAANTSNFTTVTVTDENGPDNVITPATDYSYKLYTRDNNTISGAANPAPPHYSPGVSTTTTTLPAGGVNKNWSYKTGAVTLSPPGLTPGGAVISGSNDNKLHSMSATNGARLYQPSGSIGTTGGSIQARPPVIPAAFTTGVDCDKVTPGVQTCDVAFVGSGDGNAYAFDVATGNMIWTAPSPVALPGGSVVGGAAVQLDAFSNPGFAPSCAPCDLVFFGSRNTGPLSTTNNRVVALNANTGVAVWTFSPGNMDIITSTPMVDYATNTVWVASLSNSGTQPSLWKLNSSTGALIESFSLGDISREPTLNSDGRVLYALLDSGSLAAVRTDVSACSFTLAPASGSGVGFPVPSPTAANNDDIFFTTTGTVNKFHFSYTPGVCAGTLTDLNGSGWTNPTLTNPSGVVVIPFAVVPVPQIFVGDGNGNLLRINSTTGAVAASRLVEASAVIGEPAIDLNLNRIYAGSSSGRIYSFDLF